MAAIEVTEDYKGLNVHTTTEGQDIEVSYVRSFDVLFTDDSVPITERPIVAFKDNNVPQEWSLHPHDAKLFCNSKELVVVSPFFYRVNVFYKSMPRPFSESAIETWDFATSTEPIDKDIRGYPITNSAGESADPPVTKDFYDLVLRINRNSSHFDEEQASRYIGTVNADTFKGFRPGIVKCTMIQGTPARAGYINYFVETYEFIIRWDGWWLRVLDEGFREITEVDPDGYPIYEVFKDKDGVPLSQPVLLDGYGNKLKDGVDTVFLEFEILRKMEFSRLGL